ncbi:MAG: hypothetical protein JJE04_23955 [Acidobacteriia bacterium]|nr:hypothetical protein [Terriglobia bacterium]
MHRSLFLLACLLCLDTALPAATLKKGTIRAFENYIRQREAGLQKRVSGGTFLWADEFGARLQMVKSGQVALEGRNGDGITEVEAGLIHDWTGSVFIPGVTLQKTIALVQNYDNHKKVYSPEVMDSKLRARSGNNFKIYLRLLKKKVFTVVLNTEHDVTYFPLEATRMHSRGYSTRIAEVENAGTRKEHELEPGDDHGFLWRLYTYWRFQERDGGVYMELDAISLTRGIPYGAAWVVAPIIKELPLESLTRTLEGTRNALRGH